MNPVADAIRALHRSDGSIQCGARATLAVEHSSGATSRHLDDRLRCTQPNGHPLGEHKDGICCWRVHPFSDEHVDAYEPRDFRKCVECGRRWPCATLQAVQEAEKSLASL